MNEGNTPFKSFRVFWFPFSFPAVVLGMVAWLIFWLANVLLARLFDLTSARAAVELFGANVVSSLLSFSHERVVPGTVTLFTVQCAIGIVLWATFGVAICRAVGLRLARDEYIGPWLALRFALTNARTAVLYPVLVALTLAVLSAINVVIGSLMQIPIAGLVFFLLLPVAYFIAAIMLVVGLIGVGSMGLVAAALAIERRGTLDAWGKALNYTYARPVQFLIYLVVIKVLIIDIVVHFAFQEQVLDRWTRTSLKPFWENERFERFFDRSAVHEGFADSTAAFLAQAAGSFAALFLAGFTISLALSAFTSVFMIFRRDVDGIDVSEIEFDGLPAEVPDPEPVAPSGPEAPV